MRGRLGGGSLPAAAAAAAAAAAGSDLICASGRGICALDEGSSSHAGAASYTEREALEFEAARRELGVVGVRADPPRAAVPPHGRVGGVGLVVRRQPVGRRRPVVPACVGHRRKRMSSSVSGCGGCARRVALLWCGTQVEGSSARVCGMRRRTASGRRRGGRIGCARSRARTRGRRRRSRRARPRARRAAACARGSGYSHSAATPPRSAAASGGSGGSNRRRRLRLRFPPDGCAAAQSTCRTRPTRRSRTRGAARSRARRASSACCPRWPWRPPARRPRRTCEAESERERG